MFQFFKSEHSIIPTTPAVAIARTSANTDIAILANTDGSKDIPNRILYEGILADTIPLATMIPNNVAATTEVRLEDNGELTGAHLQINRTTHNPGDPVQIILRDTLNKLLGDEPAVSEWRYAMSAPEIGHNRLDPDAEFSASMQIYMEKLVEQGTAVCMRLSNTFAATALQPTATQKADRTSNVMNDIDTLFSLIDINEKTIKSPQVDSVITQGRIIFQQFTQLHNNKK
jgi:hypothetical protein